MALSLTLRAAVAAVGPTRGLRRLFSTSFIPPVNSAASQAGEQAEPSTNLVVTGLGKRITTEKLREAFSQFGEVVHAKVATDRVSGNSRGFGFVRYATLEDAAKGVEGMDGKFLDGWVIFAEYTTPATKKMKKKRTTPRAWEEWEEYAPYNHY